MCLDRGVASVPYRSCDGESGTSSAIAQRPGVDAIGDEDEYGRATSHTVPSCRGVNSWSADVPEGIAALAWDGAPEVMVTAGGQSVAVVTPSGDGGWDLLDATGSVDAFDGFMGCGPDGVWAISATGATVDVVYGIAKLEEMPPLPTGEEVRAHRLASLGTPLFVTQAPPGEAPDEPRPARGTRPR